MKFVYSDGGRSKYFKAENVGDCVTRAICNATGKDYKEVYDRLKELAKLETDKQISRHRGHKRSSVRDGVFKETWKKYLIEIGWQHVPTMERCKGIKIHLNENELPTDKVMIVQVSKHLTCVKNGVLYDTYDCTRNGERGVYGYWVAPTKEEFNELARIRKVLAEEEADKNRVREAKKQIRYEYHLKIEKLKRDIAKLEKERDARLAEVK